MQANTRTIEVLHWDGRLDNRSDLLSRLSDSLRGETTDAAIARAVYKRWGAEGLVQLIGDWSLVIHDRETIVLASDFAGVRPLYYHVRGGRVLWSNRLQSLIDETAVTDLDEQYIAGFLTFGGYPNRTPYKGIYSVPPGHAVCVSANETKIRKFWSMPIGDTIRYRNKERYEEQLRALFRDAVAVRLQTEAPVLAELSGGLDSSSVVCLAHELVRTGAVRAPRLAGVSFTWRKSQDEPFIREVEAHCGIQATRISTHDVPLLDDVDGPIPEAFQTLFRSVAATAENAGAKTILTGQNGDLVMGNWFDDHLQVAAPLRRFQFGRAFENAVAWSKLLRLPVYQILWHAAQAALASSLTPATIYTTADGSYAPKSVETSLIAQFSKRTGASEAPNFFSNDWLHAAPERRKHFYALSLALELRTLQAPEPLQHLIYTHPFAHRPLVEFLMTVPADVLCGPGEPRKLMRAALSDLWPHKLRERRSKCSFSAPWQEASRPLARALLSANTLYSVELGFVDQASVRARLERLCRGLDCNESQLRQVILLELWLRARAHDRINIQKKGENTDAKQLRSTRTNFDWGSKRSGYGLRRGRR
ncbi:MAG TPA: asparagine synthase-related protein [Pyrinomonadaceae bacterium]|nr:asparagine synthase-related protein [Pyrinomonadaceae bacterium]